MSTFTITLPHELGLEEARRRLAARTDWAQRKLRENKVETEVSEWNGNTRSFRAKALGQTATGTLEVGETEVRLDANLPLALRAFSPVIAALAKKYAGELFAPRA